MEGPSFLGPSVSEVILALPRNLKNVNKPLFRSVVLTILSALEGKDVSTKEAINELKQSHDDNWDSIVAGLYQIIVAAYRHPLTGLKSEVFVEDLKTLGIPQEFIADLVGVVFGSRQLALEKSILSQKPQVSKLVSVHWRVDVAISTSALSRSLQPCILLKLKLGDRSVYVLEVTVSKFHLLRCNVAAVLKEMQSLEKRNLFKIQC